MINSILNSSTQYVTVETYGVTCQTGSGTSKGLSKILFYSFLAAYSAHGSFWARE